MSDKEDPPPSPDPLPTTSPCSTTNEVYEDDSSDESSQFHRSEATNSSRKKFISKIVAPSQRRGPQNGTVTPTKETTMGVRNDAMYERSKLRLAAKEQNLKRTEKEMMVGCTFTPETNKSRSSSKSGKSTPVFDRLHSESKQTTPKKANGRNGRGSPTSISSYGSSRLDSLYQDGLRRAQNRKLTDKDEAEARRRRLEEKELEQCTFQPRMDWRKKKPTVRSHGKPREPTKTRSSPRYQHSPPVHVVTTTQPVSTRDAGRRSFERNRSIVSPLRGPDIPPNAAIGIPSGSMESLGDDTEYGSI